MSSSKSFRGIVTATDKDTGEVLMRSSTIAKSKKELVKKGSSASGLRGTEFEEGALRRFKRKALSLAKARAKSLKATRIKTKIKPVKTRRR